MSDTRHGREPIHCRLDLTRPGHEVVVTLIVPEPGRAGDSVSFYLPSWAPGSYLIREFARHVDSVRAEQSGSPLDVSKSAKDEWCVRLRDGSPLELRYVLHAHELTVRTNYLGPDRALLCGAATFMTPARRERDAWRVSVVQPRGWAEPRCALPLRHGAFEAPDYDTLLDSPIAAGPCRAESFDVLGVPHEIAVYGEGDCDVERLAREARATCASAASVFGEALPCARYLFIIELGCSGGLEHAASSVCGLPTFAFASEADRRRHLSLLAHEYFHLWNVKRIRPEALGPFDYRREVVTPHLWVSEGLTSYYQHVIEHRAGHVSPRRLLTILAWYLLELERTPGRLVQSLEESSCDAWIKFYRPGENSRNSTVSYYGKGAVAGLVLDLEIRRRSGGKRSLDDAMRHLFALWKRRPERGFSDAELREAFAEAAGEPMDDVVDRCARGRDGLDVDAALATVGLAVERVRPKQEGGWLGVVLKRDGKNGVVERVARDGPAWKAGLSAGEEVVAIGGFRVEESEMAERLGQRRPGEIVTVTSVLWGRLREVHIELGQRPSVDYRIRKDAEASPTARRGLESWLGVTWDAFQPLDEKPEEQRAGRSPKEV